MAAINLLAHFYTRPRHGQPVLIWKNIAEKVLGSKSAEVASEAKFREEENAEEDDNISE